MAQVNFDASGVAPDQGRGDPLPAGWYDCAMEKSEMKPTAGGDGAYLECVFGVLQGQFQGRKLFSRFNLRNNNPQAQEIAYKQFSAVCHAIGQLQVGDSAELHGRPLKVRVKIRPAEGQYEASNDITKYENINFQIGAVPTSAGPAAMPPMMAPPMMPPPQQAAWAPPPAMPPQAPQQPAAQPWAGQPQQPVQQPWAAQPQQAPQQFAPQQFAPQQPPAMPQQAPAWQPPAGAEQQPWAQQAPQQAAPQQAQPMPPQAPANMQPAWNPQPAGVQQPAQAVPPWATPKQ